MLDQSEPVRTWIEVASVLGLFATASCFLHLCSEASGREEVILITASHYLLSSSGMYKGGSRGGMLLQWVALVISHLHSGPGERQLRSEPEATTSPA